MENKINIAELLKDCPKDMELDCSVFEDVTLYKIDTDIANEFPIRIKTKNDYFLDLTKYGTYSNVEEAKCIILPKGKTTWEGFVPPRAHKIDFKPFEPVLVRDNNDCVWKADFYSHHEDRQHYSYACTGDYYTQCIPYNEDTTHLVGTTNDCPDKYKSWKNER